MFQTVAAGMIADELPKDLVPKFLEAIQSNQGQVYMGVQQAQDDT
jgi:hypothetical protein